MRTQIELSNETTLDLINLRRCGLRNLPQENTRLQNHNHTSIRHPKVSDQELQNASNYVTIKKTFSITWHRMLASLNLTSISTVHFLVPERMSWFFTRPHRFNALQSDTSHWTFWYVWPFLKILEYQLATGCSHNFTSIWFCVVRQPPSISYSLNHLWGCVSTKET